MSAGASFAYEFPAYRQSARRNLATLGNIIAGALYDREACCQANEV